MTNLIAYNKDGLDIYIDEKSGESFASISSYARMSGLSKQAISNRTKTVNLITIKTAQINTTTGSKTVNLLTEDVIAEWIVKDNPTIALQFLKLGIRNFMRTLAGHSQPQPQVTPQQSPKALPREYDVKLDAIRFKKNAISKEINELQLQIDTRKKAWEAMDAEEDTLVIERHKDIADEVIRRRAKVEKRKVRTQQEIDDMYEKAFGGKGK